MTIKTSPPVELAWLSDRQRAEAVAWIAEQAGMMRRSAANLRLVREPVLLDEALRLEGLAATLLAMAEQHSAAPVVTDSAADRGCE